MIYRLLAVAALVALAGCVPPPPAPAVEMPMTDMPAPDAGTDQAIPTDIVPAN